MDKNLNKRLNDLDNTVGDLRNDLDKHKIETRENFEAMSKQMDNRLENLMSQSDVLRQVIADEPPEPSHVPADIAIKATPKERYKTVKTKSGIFLATNDYRFGLEDGSPADSYVKMETRGRDLHIKYKRNVEGKTSLLGQPTNEFVGLFPCGVLGTLNGREASGMPNLPLLPGVKRQYGYPAYDLRKVRNLIGLPSHIKDIHSFKVRTEILGRMYGVNGFLDLYLHNLERNGHTAGYKGKINATNGNYTKEYNLNTWFTHPSQVNSPGLANGWTGATKVADRNIDGVNVEIGLKVERVNNNEFLYVSIVPDSHKKVDYNIRALLDWVLEDLWQLISASEIAQKLLSTMSRPPTAPHDLLSVCGAHLGAEIWWSDLNNEEEIIFKDFEIEINGTSHFLDGIGTKDKPFTLEETPVPVPVNGTGEISELIFDRVGQRKNVSDSRGAQRISHLGEQDILDNQATKTWPQLSIVSKVKGETIIKWIDKEGKERPLRVIV